MTITTTVSKLNDDAQSAAQSIAIECVGRLLARLHGELNATLDHVENDSRMNYRPALDQCVDDNDAFANELVSRIQTELANAFEYNKNGGGLGPVVKSWLAKEIKEQLVRRFCN